ncbi:hypothetical protein JCM3770_000149 [Rhodotorula araucariae]
MKKLSEQQVAQQAASAARFEAQFSGKAQELRRWKWRAEPDASLVRIVDSLSQDDRRTRNWLLATRPQSQRGYPIGLTSVHPSEPRRVLQQSAQPRKGEGPGEFTNGSWEKYGELLHEWHGGQQPVGTDRQAWYEPYSRLHAEIMQGERHGGVLEYWCPDGQTCGGLADRMLGMTTTLLFALLSGRAFTATWGQPFPMELLFDSPFIDWSSPLTSLGEGSAPTDVFPPLWSNDTLLKHRQTVLLINTEAAKSEEVLDQLTTASKLSSEAWLRLDRLNRGLTLNTFRTPKRLERLSSLGLTMHTAYAQLIHFLFRPKLEALTFIAEYTSVFALPSMFVVGIQVRTGDLYMRDPEQDKINTVERHAHWFKCAQEVVETYSHPTQRPLYFLVSDSATLRSSAAAAYPDRVVTTGLAQQLDGMMGTVAENWAFSNVDFSLLSQHSGFGKIPTWKRAKPNRAIVLPRPVPASPALAEGRSMSRIPVPASPSLVPPPSTMSRPSSRRPESVYSASGSSFVSSTVPSTPPTSVGGGDALAETRKRQSRRDEAIRKKIESELSRKRPPSKRSGTSSQPQQSTRAPRPIKGTVSALRPLPALTVPHGMSVSDASQLCAAKRTDCVLVVDEDEHLCGIFTAKDLAFRVVGDGLDPRTTPVSAIMTANPMVTRDTTSATEALQTMVTRGFRHLPVCNEEGDVVGLLDITKVFHESLEKLEKAYGSSQRLYSALEGAQEQFGGVDAGASNPLLAYVQALRDKMSFPDLGSILDARTTAATVGVKTSVREAARIMREKRTTAVCVMEGVDNKKIAGIFTSKDVVLRVIAAGLDAKTCSVVRVMTPHPDTAVPSLSIQDALRKMHDGHYLNLPIVDEAGALIGIVDVLKLTYATLEQVNTLHADSGADAAGGPLWGRFFSAAAQADEDGDTESIVSGVNGSEAASSQAPFQTPTRPGHHRSMDSIDTPGSELFPGDSASVIHDDASDVGGARRVPVASSVGASQAASASVAGAAPPIVDDGTYLFKFVAPGGTTHRFQARYDSYEFLTDIVAGKLGSDPFFAAAAPGADSEDAGVAQPEPSDFQLSYRDDDGDLVLITADGDVADAVATAKKQGKDRVVLHVSGGATWKAALAAREPAQPASAPVPAVTKKLVVVEEEHGDEGASAVDPAAAGDDAREAPRRRPARKAQGGDDLVAGVLPKEYLLPASIGFLGVVIATVFIASRASGAAR